MVQMTIIDTDVVRDIERLSRAWAAAEQGSGSRTVPLDQVVRELNDTRERIRKFRETVLALYNAAELLTSNFKSTALAVAAWKELHNNYAGVLSRLEKLPRVEPGIDEAIEDLRKVLRDLEAKSEQEYRAYRETGHLLSSPANARELEESIKEAREGGLETFATVEDFKKSLRG
jgi:hypothetical protein